MVIDGDTIHLGEEIDSLQKTLEARYHNPETEFKCIFNPPQVTKDNININFVRVRKACLVETYTILELERAIVIKDWEGVTTFSNGIESIKFPEGSKMILKKIRFLDREYNFRDRFDVTDGVCLIDINRQVGQVISGFSGLSLPSFSAVWKSIDLSKIFSRTEKA